MTDSMTELDLEDFTEQFPLIENPRAVQEHGRHGDWNDCVFGMTGEDAAFVRSQDERTVWTVVLDNDRRAVAAGAAQHWNAIGYLVSTCLRTDNTLILVALEPESFDRVDD